MFREVMTYAQGHTASKQQSLYANLKQKLLAAWIWAFPAAWKSCFCHPDAVSVISCPLPRRIINSDWVLDFGFPPCYKLPPAGGSSFASVSTWLHSDQPNSLHRASLSVFFFFFPPRAQMARFRVSCFRQSGVTALVKEPEAQLIIVIAASYVRNASQAEGAQGKLPHCCCFPGDPEQGLEVACVSIRSGPPRMQGGRRLCCWRWAPARLPETLQSDASQGPASPHVPEAMRCHGI